MLLNEFLTLCLPLAGINASSPWRELRDESQSSILSANDGTIWLTLKELGRLLPQIPGFDAKRLRLALKWGRPQGHRDPGLVPRL